MEKVAVQAALLKGFFFFTTHMLPYRGFGAMVRGIFRKPWRAFEEGTKSPRRVQTDLLLDLVSRNALTEFGRLHAFGSVRSVDDYRAAVPVTDYDAFAPYIDRMCRGEKNLLTAEDPFYFARTSGTTGRAKNIPVTRRYVEEFQRAQRVWYRSFALQFPGMIKGNPLTIVSNKIEGHTESGVPYGSISRPLTFRENEVVDRVAAIPRETFHIDDFNAKYYALLRIALSTRISTIAAVNPSTIMMFAKKLNEFAPRFVRDLRDGTLDRSVEIDPKLRLRIETKLKPDKAHAQRLERLLSAHGALRPKDAWPMLCGLACWKGGSAGFYLKQFPDWYGDLPVLEFGFVASEGHFSVPLNATGDSGVFSVSSHFCEFIPATEREANPGDPFPKTLLAHEIEEGRRYFIVVSGSHGLYRYDINDIVEVTGFFNRTPMLRFLHKGGNMLSLTGEKVGESHVVTAVTNASRALNLPLDGFSVTLRLEDTPRYVFAVEPNPAISHEPSVVSSKNSKLKTQDSELLKALLARCDEELGKANLEYEAKRRSGRLGPPVLLLLAPGSFERHRIRRVAEGAPDAHVKPPHVFRSEDELRKRLDVTEEIADT
ncbi:MAG: GH3 auxin-responsive promoter family protein [Deltaproteobacteria bacterium]|nr:GH3 auxin-responsive promoter family protein [Deltaproteobacteria bacterium]